MMWVGVGIVDILKTERYTQKKRTTYIMRGGDYDD
jgi:hypothetical protein